MKELEKIKSLINTFLEPFELSCFIGTDFSFYYSDSLVEVSFLYSEKGEKGFMNSVLIHNPKVSFDVFLWSLLHEIGHSETFDYLTDEEWFSIETTKSLVQQGLIPEEEYYNCIDEVMATEWAVNFANENTNALFEFWNELQPLILDFYSSLRKAL